MFYSEVYAITTHSVRLGLQMFFLIVWYFVTQYYLFFIKSVHYHGSKGTKMDLLILVFSVEPFVVCSVKLAVSVQFTE